MSAVSPGSVAGGAGLAGLGKRLARLEPAALDEVAANPALTLPALAALAAASIMAGLGAFLWFANEIEANWSIFWRTAGIGSLAHFAMWVVAVVIGAAVIRSQRPDIGLGPAVRVGAVAGIPLSAGFLVCVPVLGFGLGVTGAALGLVALTWAFATAFRLEPRRALAGALPAFAIWAVVLPTLVTVDDPFGAGIFAMEWGNEFVESIVDAFAAIGEIETS